MEMMGVSPNNSGEFFKPTIRRAAELLLDLVAKAHNAILWEKYVIGLTLSAHITFS